MVFKSSIWVAVKVLFTLFLLAILGIVLLQTYNLVIEPILVRHNVRIPLINYTFSGGIALPDEENQAAPPDITVTGTPEQPEEEEDDLRVASS